MVSAIPKQNTKKGKNHKALLKLKKLTISTDAKSLFTK